VFLEDWTLGWRQLQSIFNGQCFWCWFPWPKDGDIISWYRILVWKLQLFQYLSPKKKSIHSLKHEPGTPAPSNSPSKSLTLTTSKSTPGSPSGDAWSVISEHEDPRHHFPTSLSLALHLTAYLCSQMLTANISTWPPTAKPMKEMILNDLLMFPCEPVGRAI